MSWMVCVLLSKLPLKGHFSPLAEEPQHREQIALHILHNSFNGHDLIVSHSEVGKGIYFRMDEGFLIEQLPEDEIITGSVMVDKHFVLEKISVTSGIFYICALNYILNLDPPIEQCHFLTFIEKEILRMHRLIHTPLTVQLKKLLNKNKKMKVLSSAIELAEN